MISSKCKTIPFRRIRPPKILGLKGTQYMNKYTIDSLDILSNRWILMRFYEKTPTCRANFSTSFSSWVETKYTGSVYSTRSLRIWYSFKVPSNFQKSFLELKMEDFGFFQTGPRAPPYLGFMHSFRCRALL